MCISITQLIFLNVEYMRQCIHIILLALSLGVCYCGIQRAVFTQGRCAIIRTMKLERVGNNAYLHIVAFES